MAGELAAGVRFACDTLPHPWRAAQVIYCEALSNPLVEVGELAAVARFARERGLTSVIDATFATPVLLRPHAALGFDVVLHSLTKYINGHSDVLAGAVAGTSAFIAKARCSSLLRKEARGGCREEEGSGCTARARSARRPDWQGFVQVRSAARPAARHAPGRPCARSCKLLLQTELGRAQSLGQAVARVPVWRPAPQRRGLVAGASRGRARR